MTYILVVVLVGFLLILSLYMATKACSRKKATMDRAKSLLLVMSSVETHPMLARLLDRLAGSLGALGFDVDSTIWRRTEITPVGAARWIHEQVGSYDHVIICMGLDGGMQEGTCDVTDPFPVVLDLAQHGNLKNYSVVSFNRRNKFWSFLFLPRIFEIPDEFYDLAKNISTNLNLKEIIRVKKMLKKELAEIIGNY
uniref:SEFIR domain-containing protein n=1 Tax=Ciona savignyi TaxID=51511 RepID=H2YL73_CIOSA